MIRWLRVIVPEPSLLAVFAVYGGGSALVLWEGWLLGLPLKELRQMPQAVLGFGTVCYAAGRAFAFHPWFLPAYRKWLAATPWTSRKPLPFGRVHLVPQDVFLVGSVLLLARLLGDGWVLWVPQLFLAIYLAILGWSLFETGCWGWGYAVAFGLGLAVWLARAQPACLGVELLTYAAAYLGLRQSLARFPWEKGGLGPTTVRVFSLRKLSRL